MRPSTPRRSGVGVAVRRLLAVLLVLTGLAVEAQPPPPTQPTFRAGTTLIEVSAIVTRDGQPVTDLRADEVSVLDNGKPQPLVAFEFVDLTAKADAPEQRRDFVLVLDDLGIEPKHTVPARDVGAALVAGLGQYDRLAVVNTGPHELVQQLSTDRESARTLLRRFRGQKTGMTSAYQVCHATVVKLKVISNAARVMGRGPLERRTILVVSEGRPIYIGEWFGSSPDETCLEARRAYDEVVAAAALTNTAIYGIDPRGLQASLPAPPTGTDREIVTAVGQAAQAVADAIEGRYHGSLGLMAASTGGTLTTDRNNLTADVPTMIRDSRQYYRLVYVQPDVPADDVGKPRTIDVKVTRRDVDVRARRRYMPR